MKKFLLLAIVVLLSAGAVTADAKISFPGFPKEKARKENKMSEPRKSFVLSKIHPVNAPVKMTIDPKDMVDKSMLTSYKKTSRDGNYESVETGSFTYDEYGFLKTVTDNSGNVYTYEYTWREPGRVWSSRSISSNGVTATKTRTFHPNGMVETETEEFYFRRFDENGYLIEETFEDGENHYDSHRFTYFPLSGEWYESVYRLDGIEEYTFTDNSVTRTEKIKHGEKWYYRSINTQYYDKQGEVCGYLQKDYIYTEEDGNKLMSASGSLCETITENGINYITNKNYDYDLGWRVSDRYVETVNYNDPYIYKPGEVRSHEYYSDSNGDNKFDSDELRSKTVFTWEKDRILKEEYNHYQYDEHDIYYYLVAEDGTEYSSIAYNTTNGSYWLSEWNSEEDADYYTLYDSNHKEIEVFRAIQDNRDLEIWEKKNGNVWEKCTGTITLGSDSSDKYVITFDAQGRAIRYEEWESGFIDEYATYTYDADGKGWHMNEYEVYTDGQTTTERKSGEEGYRIHDDGAIEDWHIEYYLDGDIYGSKDIVYKNHAIKEFRYKDGAWVFERWSTENTVTEDENGFIQNISYNVDESGNVTYDRKEIYKNIYEGDYEYSYNKTYIWSTETSEWVGLQWDINSRSAQELSREQYEWEPTTKDWVLKYKRFEKVSNFPDIDYIEPIDPLAISDEYFFETDKYPAYDAVKMYSLSYEWNPETEKLEITHAYGEEYEKISDKVVKITDYNDVNREGIMTYYFKIDDKQRLIEYKNHTWAYNDKDQVIMHNIDPYIHGTESQHYEYTYTDLKVWSGIEDIAGEDIKVLTTYNLAGVAVEADNLTAGVYIQKLSDGSSRKIVVK